MKLRFESASEECYNESPYPWSPTKKTMISTEARHDAQNFSESVHKREKTQRLNMSEARTDI